MLQQTERFQNDVKRYRDAIEKLPNEESKTEAKKLLNNLIIEVKSLDNAFADMVYKKQIPAAGGEVRDRIMVLRKKLDTSLKSYLT
jgi:hypothetical protein